MVSNIEICQLRLCRGTHKRIKHIGKQSNASELKDYKKLIENGVIVKKIKVYDG